MGMSSETLCSVCGMKIRQASTMFNVTNVGKARLIDAELKSMCYKKGTDYCGDYISGKAGSAPWALMASHCEAPRDPWQRPLPSGTECSAACGTTMSRIASEWGCCLQSMAIANDRA